MENKEYPKRKRIRLPEYDYTAGTYFVTVCVANRAHILSVISDESGVGATSGRPPCAMVPNGVGATMGRPFSPIVTPIGQIVQTAIHNIPVRYPDVQIDEYVIMPDHVHIILTLSPQKSGRPMVAPTLQRIIQHFKAYVSKRVGSSIWQKSFYEHIIRDASDYDEKMKYLYENPMRWYYEKIDT